MIIRARCAVEMLATLLEAAAPRGAALGSAAATVMPLPLPPSLPRALAWGDEVSVSHVRAVQKYLQGVGGWVGRRVGGQARNRELGAER